MRRKITESCFIEQQVEGFIVLVLQKVLEDCKKYDSVFSFWKKISLGEENNSSYFRFDIEEKLDSDINFLYQKNFEYLKKFIEDEKEAVLTETQMEKQFFGVKLLFVLRLYGWKNAFSLFSGVDFNKKGSEIEENVWIKCLSSVKEKIKSDFEQKNLETGLSTSFSYCFSWIEKLFCKCVEPENKEWREFIENLLVGNQEFENFFFDVVAKGLINLGPPPKKKRKLTKVVSYEGEDKTKKHWKEKLIELGIYKDKDLKNVMCERESEEKERLEREKDVEAKLYGLECIKALVREGRIEKPANLSFKQVEKIKTKYKQEKKELEKVLEEFCQPEEEVVEIQKYNSSLKKIILELEEMAKNLSEKERQEISSSLKNKKKEEESEEEDTAVVESEPQKPYLFHKTECVVPAFFPPLVVSEEQQPTITKDSFSETLVGVSEREEKNNSVFLSSSVPTKFLTDWTLPSSIVTNVSNDLTSQEELSLSWRKLVGQDQLNSNLTYLEQQLKEKDEQIGKALTFINNLEEQIKNKDEQLEQTKSQVLEEKGKKEQDCLFLFEQTRNLQREKKLEQEKNNELKNENRQLKNDLEKLNITKEEKIKQAERRLSQLQENKDRAAADFGELNNSLEKEVKDLRQDKQKLQSDLKVANKKLERKKDLELKLEEEQDKNKKKEGEINLLRGQKNNIEKEKKELEKVLEDVRQERDNIYKERSWLEEKLEKTENLNQKYLSQSSEIQEMNEQLEGDKEWLENNNELLLNEIKAKDRTISDLENQLKYNQEQQKDEDEDSASLFPLCSENVTIRKDKQSLALELSEIEPDSGNVSPILGLFESIDDSTQKQDYQKNSGCVSCSATRAETELLVTNIQCLMEKNNQKENDFKILNTEYEGLKKILEGKETQKNKRNELLKQYVSTLKEEFSVLQKEKEDSNGQNKELVEKFEQKKIEISLWQEWLNIVKNVDYHEQKEQVVVYIQNLLNSRMDFWRSNQCFEEELAKSKQEVDKLRDKLSNKDVSDEKISGLEKQLIAEKKKQQEELEVAIKAKDEERSELERSLKKKTQEEQEEKTSVKNENQTLKQQLTEEWKKTQTLQQEQQDFQRTTQEQKKQIVSLIKETIDLNAKTNYLKKNNQTECLKKKEEFEKVVFSKEKIIMGLKQKVNTLEDKLKDSNSKVETSIPTTNTTTTATTGSSIADKLIFLSIGAVVTLSLVTIGYLVFFKTTVKKKVL